MWDIWENGIHKTSNHGINWTPTSVTQPVASLYSVGSTVLAGVASGDIVLRSPNSGNNWSPSNSGLPAGAYVNCFHANAGIIYAGVTSTFEQLYKSSDDGVTWSTPMTTSLPNEIIAIATAGSYIFVETASPNFIFRSDNGGATWGPTANNGIPLGSMLTKIFNVGNTLFVGTDHGVFMSQNFGDNWTSFNTGLNASTTCESFAANTTHLFTNGIEPLPALVSAAWQRPLSDILAVPELVTMLNGLYPNPANDGIFYFPNLKDQINVEVFTIIGSKVVDTRCDSKNNKISIGNKPGIYFLRVSDKEGKTGTGKLLIQ